MRTYMDIENFDKWLLNLVTISQEERELVIELLLAYCGRDKKWEER